VVVVNALGEQREKSVEATEAAPKQAARGGRTFFREILDDEVAIPTLEQLEVRFRSLQTRSKKSADLFLPSVNNRISASSTRRKATDSSPNTAPHTLALSLPPVSAPSLLHLPSNLPRRILSDRPLNIDTPSPSSLPATSSSPLPHRPRRLALPLLPVSTHSLSFGRRRFDLGRLKGRRAREMSRLSLPSLLRRWESDSRSSRT
jgi:hypothetical protein